MSLGCLYLFYNIANIAKNVINTYTFTNFLKVDLFQFDVKFGSPRTLFSPNFPQTFPGLSPDLPWTFPRPSLGFPRTFPGPSPEFPQTFPRLSLDLTQTFPRLIVINKLTLTRQQKSKYLILNNPVVKLH